MMHSLSISSWNALHPLIIHFPIALLLIAPLFVVVGAVISPPKGRAFLVSALILMVLGTASMFLAVGTGEAAGHQIAGSTPAIKSTLAEHQDLAGTTLVLFSLLTVAFAALLSVSGSLQLDRRVNTALLAAFLVFYATGALFLVNTARRGGRLVHEFGVRAPVASSTMALDHSGSTQAGPALQVGRLAQASARPACVHSTARITSPKGANQCQSKQR
ncbi:MAG TPA: DUF2231 domain-containing protein [Terriglobia bacterium]|nr:DUF2231 domain-containing protein [Terriglobia bacterium]